MSREVDGVLADDGQLAPSRLRMRRKLFDTLLIGAPEDERLREFFSCWHQVLIDVYRNCLLLCVSNCRA